jgi:hypothetical protein
MYGLKSEFHMGLGFSLAKVYAFYIMSFEERLRLPNLAPEPGNDNHESVHDSSRISTAKEAMMGDREPSSLELLERVRTADAAHVLPARDIHTESKQEKQMIDVPDEFRVAAAGDDKDIHILAKKAQEMARIQRQERMRDLERVQAQKEKLYVHPLELVPGYNDPDDRPVEKLPQDPGFHHPVSQVSDEDFILFDGGKRELIAKGRARVSSAVQVEQNVSLSQSSDAPRSSAWQRIRSALFGKKAA